jgi:DNA-binding HxlR family transcriptional regulator
MTDFGQTLEPILRMLKKWGVEYLEQITEIRRAGIQQANAIGQESQQT